MPVPVFRSSTTTTTLTLTDDRNVNRTNFRTRGDLILDARAQTAIGTVRTYISIGADWNNNLTGASAGTVTRLPRARVHPVRGLHGGSGGDVLRLRRVLLDLRSGEHRLGLASGVRLHGAVRERLVGHDVDRRRASRSLEDRRGRSATGLASRRDTTTSLYGGQQVPDIVANFRVDQAWGSAQVSGVLHQLRVNEARRLCWRYSDAWGWAVLGGIEIKTPMIAPGDSIMLQGVYSKGAVEYTGISSSPLGVAQGIGYRNVAGVGPATDIYDAFLSCIVYAATHLQLLTTAWSWNVMFRHFWQPNLRSAFWVGYNRYEPGPDQRRAFDAPIDDDLAGGRQHHLVAGSDPGPQPRRAVDAGLRRNDGQLRLRARPLSAADARTSGRCGPVGAGTSDPVRLTNLKNPGGQPPGFFLFGTSPLRKRVASCERSERRAGEGSLSPNPSPGCLAPLGGHPLPREREKSSAAVAVWFLDSRLRGNERRNLPPAYPPPAEADGKRD